MLPSKRGCQPYIQGGGLPAANSQHDPGGRCVPLPPPGAPAASGNWPSCGLSSQSEAGVLRASLTRLRRGGRTLRQRVPRPRPPRRPGSRAAAAGGGRPPGLRPRAHGRHRLARGGPALGRPLCSPPGVLLGLRKRHASSLRPGHAHGPGARKILPASAFLGSQIRFFFFSGSRRGEGRRWGPSRRGSAGSCPVIGSQTPRDGAPQPWKRGPQGRPEGSESQRLAGVGPGTPFPRGSSSRRETALRSYPDGGRGSSPRSHN